MKYILIILAIALTGCAEKITERQQNILNELIAEDIRGQRASHSSAFFELPSHTPRSVLAAYSRNEVAADKQLKDKEIYISGVVREIGVDIVGTGYVAFESGSGFTGATAYMKDKSSLEALNNGDSVSFVCKVDGKSLVIVAMKNCQFSYDWMVAKGEELKKRVISQIANPKESASDEVKKAASYVMGFDKHLAQDTQCGKDSAKCVAEMRKLLSDIEKKQG